jgi:4-hydroxy-tetrahydrodipicolinate synthase
MTGAMTALITPFKNGKVDSETFAKLIQRQIERGFFRRI